MTVKRPALDWQPVLVAAGASRRYGSADKLLERIASEPVVIRSLRTLLAVESAHPLVAVVNDETGGAVAAWAARQKDADIRLVDGGKRRRDSVEAAMEVCKGEYVAVHDGARPLATPDLLRRLLAAARGGPGAVPGLPPVDTIATVDDGTRVSSQLDRAALRAVQTPQVVRREDWLRAAGLDSADAMDDAGMLLRVGLRCALVPGEPFNVKLTARADLTVIRALAAELEG